MLVRNTHHGDGPQLETSLSKTHPAYPKRMEELSIYASILYAKLVEYGRASYAPTTDGAYRDLFAHGSPSRTTDLYVHGTPSPEQIANQGFNLLIKIREHEDQLFLVVAPTATTAEQNTLQSALADIHDDWQHLRGGARSLKPAVVYHWLLEDQPHLELWSDAIDRPELFEADTFHAVPQQ
jgi:hypothetical protein